MKNNNNKFGEFTKAPEPSCSLSLSGISPQSLGLRACPRGSAGSAGSFPKLPVLGAHLRALPQGHLLKGLCSEHSPDVFVIFQGVLLESMTCTVEVPVSWMVPGETVHERAGACGPTSASVPRQPHKYARLCRRMCRRMCR